MADRYVPIQTATIRQTEDGKLVTDATSTGGSLTSDSATTEVKSVGNAATVLLLPTNPNRKGFILYSNSSLIYILYGGANEAGDTAIPAGDPGAVDSNLITGHFSVRLTQNGSVENGPGNTLWTGPITAIATSSAQTVMVTEFE